MTIAQALKEKNKVTAKLQKIWHKIASYNSVAEGGEQPYDIAKLWDEHTDETINLVRLKTAIHAASAPVREDIFTLSELKSRAGQVRNLNTTSGNHRDRYSSDAPIKMLAHFGIEWKDAQVDALEKHIDSIQEKLDAFNHTTNI